MDFYFFLLILLLHFVPLVLALIILVEYAFGRIGGKDD